MAKGEMGSEQLWELSGLKSNRPEGSRRRSKQMLQSYSWELSKQENLLVLEQNLN